MLLRYATEQDISSWLLLAKHGSPILSATSMTSDPEFSNFMVSKIVQKEALIAVDMISNSCLGVIACSKEDNAISWFGMYDMYSSSGIGSHLLDSALDLLDRSKAITVQAYAENFEPGESNRNLYKKFGFVDSGDAMTDAIGNPMTTMVLKPFVLPPLKLLSEIKHVDLGFPASEVSVNYVERRAARSVLLNAHNEVALIYVAKGHYYKLPGGGLEENEDFSQALKREILEEVGANIEIIDSIGMIKEYRDNYEQLQISCAFLCKVVGEIHTPNLTYMEKEMGFECQWVPLEDAVTTISHYSGSNYMAKFVSLRDATILTEAIGKLQAQ
jgi:ADP-ribose pyrophosphatase YjhB (NUDIX family)/ribosomal protein S18 acetylase RimI-like enzyme